MRFDPRRPDFAPYGLTCERWTPSLMRRPDRHNEIELNLLESGSITYLSGGRKVKIDAHRLAVFWAAIPHQIIDIVGRHTYFVATLPLAWFLQCGFDDRLVQPILHGQFLSDPSTERGTSDTELFRRWFSDLKKAGAPGRRAMMLELEARLVRLASSLPSRNSNPRPARTGAIEAQRLTKAEQMACFIAQHYLEPLSVEQISQSVQLHPNYAMNLFKRVFSTTVTDYVSQHRISHSQRLLATTDEKILSVALSSGFGSISRFNSVFRRACGTSPKEYRKGHRI
jgi:AraC family transcriptional regulator, melibiose operon regulatory protein